MDKLKPNQFLLPSGAKITERPILFSTDMVKANLEDRKTQTRRTRGLDTANENPDLWEKKGNDTIVHKEHGFIIDSANAHYGQSGDLLWVRESFTIFMDGILFKSRESIFKNPKWKPSIHMPKSYAQLWLMVEEIRVERLKDISEEDANSEGVIEYEDGTFKNYFTQKGLRTQDGVEILLAKGSFQSLWASIKGRESWDYNPWVWVVKYRILSKEFRPSLKKIEKNYLEVTRKEAHHA